MEGLWNGHFKYAYLTDSCITGYLLNSLLSALSAYVLMLMFILYLKQGDPGVRGPMGNPGKEGPKVRKEIYSYVHLRNCSSFAGS